MDSVRSGPDADRRLQGRAVRRRTGSPALRHRLVVLSARLGARRLRTAVSGARRARRRRRSARKGIRRKLRSDLQRSNTEITENTEEELRVSPLCPLLSLCLMRDALHMFAQQVAPEIAA